MARTRKRSVKEIRAQIRRLEEEMEVKKLEETLEQIASSREFKSVARKLVAIGLSAAQIGELFTGRPKRTRSKKKATKKKRGKVKPKYRHPKNSKLTWTGRGMQPRWVRDAIAEGVKLDDLLIKESGSRKS